VQPVPEHEGHLQRRTGALQRRCRQRHQRIAAFAGEGAHCLPGRLGCRGTRIDAGQTARAAPTDRIDIHTVDLREVEVDPGGDDEEVVSDTLTARGHDRVGRRFETRHHVADPGYASRMEVRISVPDLLYRPDTRRNQRIARLVVVLFLAVDQGDSRPVEQPAEPIRDGDAAQPAAGDDDVRRGLQRRTRGRRMPRGKGSGRDGQRLEPATAAGIGDRIDHRLRGRIMRCRHSNLLW